MNVNEQGSSCINMRPPLRAGGPPIGQNQTRSKADTRQISYEQKIQ